MVVVVSVKNNGTLSVAEGDQVTGELGVVGLDGVSSPVGVPLRSDDAALL